METREEGGGRVRARVERLKKVRHRRVDGSRDKRRFSRKHLAEQRLMLVDDGS